MKETALLNPLTIFQNKKGKSILTKYGIMITLLFICIIFSLFNHSFANPKNLANVLRQSSIIGIIAIGTTFVIIGGGFDISVGAVMGLTAAISLSLSNDMPWGYAIIITLAVGAGIGFINGFLTAKIKIASIITTLGTYSIVRGLLYLYTKSQTILGYSKSFKLISWGKVANLIPIPIIILIISVIVWQFILRKTQIGRYSCAVGGNKEAARLSGIPVNFYHILTFVIGGLMAAMAGILYAARTSSVNTKAGDGYELDAIAATVIGGTSVSGGEGSIIGTIIGVLLLNIIGNMFQLLGMDTAAQKIIKGAIILIVVGIDSYNKSKK